MSPAFTAIILAAQRPGETNPLAAAAGVSHKCLVPIAGAPLIVHVVRVLAAMPSLGALRISVEPELWLVLEDLLAPERRPGLAIEMRAPQSNIADSVIAGVEGAEGPFVVTTADNVLLTATAVELLLGRLEQADAAAILTTREAVRAVHPDAQRRFYRLGNGHYSNCNLYGVRDAERAFAAAGVFRGGGQFRRHVGRAIRALGLINILLVLSGRLGLDAAARRFSRRLGLRLDLAVADDGALAVDVDNARTHAIAEPILARRMGPRGGAAGALGAYTGMEPVPL
jgi:GTP:adenosylcobinamide-phosphate guanylyltransferase